MRVNGDKSEALLFTRKRATRHVPVDCVTIAESEVPWGQSLKHLGMYLDPRQTYKPHVEYILEKSQKTIRLLYPLINRRSRLSIDLKLLLYKSIFRPALTYASPVWSTCAKSHRKRLQILQNKLLKMFMNLPPRFSTASVHEKCNIDMMDDYLTSMRRNFETNCRLNPNPDINCLFE